MCLLLGAWAAAIRPRDPQAWLLLALMFTFPHFFLAQELMDFGPGWRSYAAAYSRLLRAATPLAIALFGMYFVERVAIDAKFPWLKWVFLIPAGLSGAAYAAGVPGSASWHQAIFLLAVAIFFSTLGMKLGMTANPDARRRFRLLAFGTQAAMTPMFAVILASYALRQQPAAIFPYWFIAAALLCMFLFPATITYVVVVHRALDVRVVVRQGIQYALARGGARIFIAVLAAAVILAASEWALAANMSRLRRYTATAAAVAAVFLLSRVSRSLAAWIDRRFFRQAYDAERVLTELGDEVRTLVDPVELPKTVASKIASTLNVPRVAFFLEDGDGFRPSGNGDREPVFASGGGTVAHLRQTGQPARVYFDDNESWIYHAPAMTAAERDALRRLESQLLLPLQVKDRTLGFISLGQKLSEEPYSGSDLRLLRTLASQTGLAIDNSRLASAYAREASQREKLNREVEIAREVQERLFPQKIPSIAGFDIAGGCRPALAVGGDYYDFLLLGENKLGVVIGDISGKGIAAALLMASLQASVRSQSQAGLPIASLIAAVNTLIYESSTASRYATLFYAQIDTKTLAMDYCNAGHNPPLLLRAGGGVEKLEIGGTMVGLLPRFPFQQGRVQLAAGDLLLGFTDGISEAQNAAYDEWGEDNLAAATRAAGAMPAAQLIPHLMTAADAFVAGAPQHDDMTMVVVRVCETAAGC